MFLKLSFIYKYNMRNLTKISLQLGGHGDLASTYRNMGRPIYDNCMKYLASTKSLYFQF